ncbi:MAG: pyridoxal-phosphate dependent enzyme [Desulfovibrio sp.]|nr:MAG: pyridoxal-phosphate dependent enzyme [Desulfovibrio sp.]
MGSLVCAECGETRPLTEQSMVCPCGGLWNVAWSGCFDPKETAGRPWNLWRYAEALPVAPEFATSLGEGTTPLVEVVLDGKTALIKQEQLFPTGSYKDRGAALLISRMRELGVGECVEDSSGNAGCAVAAYCARAGIRCRILVPEATSPAKLTQIQAYGAELELVPGNRDATARAALNAAKDHFYASHSYNPFFFHGTKTFAFEVAEQLGWQAPDTVVLPAGNGTLLLGAYLGFTELKAQGITDRLPRLVAVQAEHCAPLATAFARGEERPAAVEPRPTAAEGIAIGEPVRGAQMLAAVRDTQGEFLAVSEQEILAARNTAHTMGFYIEPTAGAAFAGLLRYVRDTSSDEAVVSVFTGHGLKSPPK